MTPEQIADAQRLLSSRRQLLEIRRDVSTYANRSSLQVTVNYDGHDVPTKKDILASRKDILLLLDARINMLTHQLLELGVVFPEEGVEI